MKKILFAMTLLFAAPAAHAADKPGVVEVKVAQLRNLRGKLGCLLFAKEDGFPQDAKQAAARLQLEPTGNVVTCRFENVAPGTYAVSVMHDENGDGKLETNFVGIPTEGYGASNNKLPAMSAPSFADSRFTVAPGEEKRLDVRLEY